MNKSSLSALILAVFVSLMTGCSGYDKIMKATDYDYRYELAKTLYVQGKYSNAASIIEGCVVMFRGKAVAEEAIFMLSECYYKMNDYLSASQYYKTYYRTFPNGSLNERARFMSGKCLYYDTPDPKLDATSTFGAIDELQLFIETYPLSQYRKEASDMVYEMYDRLAEKELKSATLYFNLGNYLGNNYRSAIITAQNALLDYPYTRYREEISFLILRSKFKMAEESVREKKDERYRETIDEYYAFKNDFPESGYLKEVEKIFQNSTKKVNN